MIYHESKEPFRLHYYKLIRVTDLFSFQAFVNSWSTERESLSKHHKIQEFLTVRLQPEPQSLPKKQQQQNDKEKS